LAPRLACWEVAGHPDQILLTAALKHATDLLAVDTAEPGAPLALRLDVSLDPKVPLLDEHDLDNYVYPLASYLSKLTPGVFVSVWRTKQYAEDSYVRVEPAVQVAARTGLATAPGSAPTASASTPAYKQQVHDG